MTSSSSRGVVARMRVLTPSEKLDWLQLVRSAGIGPIGCRKLLDRLGTARRVLDALPGMIAAGTAANVVLCPREDAARELVALDTAGAALLAHHDPDYPSRLREIPDPPPVLTVLGAASRLAGPAVALVGARNASGNGRRFARRLAAELAEAGLVVVSGLARGIDAAAHEGALDGGGATVAVIASGVDVAYPEENAALMARIAGQGAVVSERPLGAAPRAKDFPRRNRIISGLALGVVVVEAAPRSGSLITAELAAEQGREVMAVPGTPLDPRHRGTNQLLRNGAQLVESAADVLEILRPLLATPRAVVPRQQPAAFRRAATPAPAAAPERAGTPVAAPPAPAAVDGLAASLRARLGPEPVALDELIRDCATSAALMQAALLELELDGRIERHPGNLVSLRLD
ncbi:MAG TPA: DNA-processing protein DprA [Geminicoccaceae bacterium]|nr:DNA-processing protein DprA [Geminicoccaceae bacterium]